jgi:hypothetical protein
LEKAGMMNKTVRFGFVMILTLMGLSACVTSPERPTYANITFQHLAPIRLDVSEVRVVSEFRSTLKSPNVEHEMPVKIDATVRQWVKDRIEVTGNQNAFAVVTIKDASVIESKLTKQTGLTGIFTNDQSEQYSFRVAVEMSVQEVNGAKGLVTAEATREKTIPEDSTLNVRDSMYFDQTETLMREFDAQMEKNIRAFMPRFIR